MHAIEDRRELTRKVQALHGTHRAAMLRDFVDMLWRDVELQLVQEPAAEDSPDLLLAMGRALDSFKEKLTLLAPPRRTRFVSAFDGRAEIVLLVSPVDCEPAAKPAPATPATPVSPLPPQPLQTAGSKVMRAMQIFEASPHLSIRQVAAQVPCSPSLLSRSPVFQRFHEAFVREARRGSKFGGQVDADGEG